MKCCLNVFYFRKINAYRLGYSIIIPIKIFHFFYCTFLRLTSDIKIPLLLSTFSCFHINTFSSLFLWYLLLCLLVSFRFKMDFKIPLLLVTLSYACLIFMTADALPLGEALDKEIAEELGLFKPVPDRRERLLASLSNPSKSMDYGFREWMFWIWYGFWQTFITFFKKRKSCMEKCKAAIVGFGSWRLMLMKYLKTKSTCKINFSGGFVCTLFFLLMSNSSFSGI